MTSAKEQVLNFIQELPEDLPAEDLERMIFEELRYRRHVREMTERSRNDIAEGRVFSHEEAGKILGIDS